ncbi:DUF6965 family protein [Pedobacter frigoris]|uniref:DUF6965 domain-containing protein n=1 Tax=Pedobacter frigoris TaxID=2571272 RepID=A0A4V5NZB4_9SPHI|nr:hypothetical protein [Pedobacter frigoris]TKC06233.1 hypothetical protein FA047_13000 [Pedobacter frigoris]
MTTEEVQDLENSLHGLKLPNAPIELYSGSTIVDVDVFIERQLNILRTAVGSKGYPPAYQHLKDFIKIVEETQDDSI